MALPVMCFSWVKPIEFYSWVKQGKANTSRKRFSRNKTVRQYTTTCCVVKTIFIPYLVKFYEGFRERGSSYGHEIRMKKNDILKPRASCVYHEK
jgi:hypothetical protein